MIAGTLVEIFAEKTSLGIHLSPLFRCGNQNELRKPAPPSYELSRFRRQHGRLGLSMNQGLYDTPVNEILDGLETPSALAPPRTLYTGHGHGRLLPERFGSVDGYRSPKGEMPSPAHTNKDHPNMSRDLGLT